MKKLAFLTLFGASALMAGHSEHAYLYKDARIMGMGGANVAVGGYSTSVFHNPAGLANIKKSHGVEVELLGVSVTASEKMNDFGNDLSDAADTNSSSAVADVLKQYSGEHFHLDVSNYSSVSYNGDAFAFSIGLLASGDVNMIAHGNGGTNDLVEVHARTYSGAVLGVAKRFDKVGAGSLELGVGVKYISQNSYEGGLGITEIIDNQDDLGKYLEDNYEKSGSGVGFDLGAIYELDGYWKPAFGLSLINIGGLDIDDAYGSQPMTLNIGASVSPEVAYLEHFRLAVDYVDLLNANKTYYYDFSVAAGEVTDVSRSEADDTDMIKRLRLGASLGLVDNFYFMSTLNVGLYQGNYTAGLDLQLAIFKIEAATYAEEIGPESGQLTDRRYIVGFGIGW